jgi:hypothetical protein
MSIEVVGGVIFAFSLIAFEWEKRIIELKNAKKILKKFIRYTSEPLPETIVVDCKHPTAYQLTHHLKKNEKNLMNLRLRGDTSTDAVMNALKSNDLKYFKTKFVSTNHFDVDSFTSVWCVLNPELALKHEAVIREVAKIGDFRELRFTCNL